MTEHQSSLPIRDMPDSKPDDGSDSYRVGSTLLQADPSKRADSCKTSLRNCRRWNCGRLACSHSRFALVSKSTNPLKASDALHGRRTSDQKAKNLRVFQRQQEGGLCVQMLPASAAVPNAIRRRPSAPPQPDLRYGVRGRAVRHLGGLVPEDVHADQAAEPTTQCATQDQGALRHTAA